MIPFLSDLWFARAGQIAATLSKPRPDASCRLQYQAAHHRWVQVIEDGRITRWEPGELLDADLEIRWSVQDAYRILHRQVTGTEALAETTVANGHYVGPPSPMDLGQRPELASMPRLPGATLDVQYEHPAGPFGHVSYAISFVDGQVGSMMLGKVDAPDAVVEVPYLAMVLVRLGKLSIYQALERGRVDGQTGPLALLAGLSDSEELHAAERACGGSGLALAHLGEVTSVAEFDEAMRSLAVETAAP
jgi:hypothetical protein